MKITKVRQILQYIYFNFKQFIYKDKYLITSIKQYCYILFTLRYKHEKNIRQVWTRKFKKINCMGYTTHIQRTWLQNSIRTMKALVI